MTNEELELFQLNNSPIKDLNTLKKELLENLLFLKSLSNREYILFQKFETLREIYKSKNFKESEISYVKSRLMTRDDIDRMMDSKDNDVKLIKCDSTQTLKTWTILRHFLHSMQNASTPGRTQRYYLEINGKIAGFLNLSSDFMTVSLRDKFIGWTVEDITHKHKLNNTLLGSVIAPSQPFGYLATGGKLMTFLCISDQVISSWEQKYKDKIVVFNTTSLFGAASQYNGMPKYFKILGETLGTGVAIYPSPKIHLQNYAYINKRVQEVSEKMKEIIKKSDSNDKNFLIQQIDKINNYKIGSDNPEGVKYSIQKKQLNDFEALVPDEVKNLPDYELFKKFNIASIQPSFKTQLINLFYKYSNFKEYMKETMGSEVDFSHGFHRGIIYSKLYENSNEFLRSEITEDQLIPRTDWDFDRKSINSIFEYWKTKYGIKRYNKMKDLKDDKCFYVYLLDTPMRKLLNKYKGKFYIDDFENVKSMFYDFLKFTEENTEFKEESLSIF